MDGYFYRFFYGFISVLSLDGIFLILCGVVFFSGVLSTILGRYINAYTLKKRLWYVAVVVFSVLCCCSFCIIAQSGYALPFFISALSCLFFIPVAFVKPKNKDYVKARELAKFIDKNIYGDNTIKDVLDENVERLQDRDEFIANDHVFYDNDFKVKEQKEKKNKDLSTAKDFELDFQHVKNVISRLDYYELKDSDKRQVKELENALLSAERGAFDLDVKSRINEGLGALLKIMSKYGI